MAINDRRRTKAAWKKSTAAIELARSTHESRVLAFVDVLQKTIKDHGIPLTCTEDLNVTKLGGEKFYRFTSVAVSTTGGALPAPIWTLSITAAGDFRSTAAGHQRLGDPGGSDAVLDSATMDTIQQ